MPVFSREGVNILFIHIPKSAGSSIEKIGDDLGWSESFSVRGKKLHELSYYKSTLQHLHAQVLNKVFYLGKFDAIFTVVRNPFSRLKSEYYWQKHQGLTTLGVDEWVDGTFGQYQKDNSVYDNHIRPQVEFIPSEYKVHVFKLEENGVGQAAKLFGAGSTLTYKQRLKRLIGLRQIPKANEKKSEKILDVEKAFDSHYEKIVDFYRADYEAFAYQI